MERTHTKKERPADRQADPGPLPKLVVPGVSDDGPLPHDRWSSNLPVQVLNSDFIAGAVIQLTVDDQNYGAPRTVLPGEAGDPTVRFAFEINKSIFPSGNPAEQLRLNYTVYDPSTGLTTPSPFPFSLMFDKAPPGGEPLAYIGFSPQQLLGIYPSSLIGGNLSTSLAPWSKMAIGDRLAAWLGSTPPNQGNIGTGLIPETSVVVSSANLGRSIDVLFPQARLLALGDVTQHFGYQLTDALGNASEISPARQIPVHLQSTPGRRRQNPMIEAPRVAGIRSPDGRVPLSMLRQRIPVIVPYPPNPRPGDVVRLYKNGYEAQHAIGIEIPLPTTPVPDFTLYIEQADFPGPGTAPGVVWKVDYRIYDPFSDTGVASYKPVQMIFDQLAPGGTPPVPGAISFTADQLSGITPADIDPVQNGLVVHIAAWYDNDVDDRVELWLGTGPAAATGIYLSTVIAPVTDPQKGINVTFPRSELEKLPAGLIYFGYRVTDWAGNVSDLSATTPINVQLVQPVQPPALDVLEDTEPTHILDISNLTRITARVPDYGMQANDSVFVRWSGNNVHDTAPRLVNAPGALDFDIPLAWAQEDANDFSGVTLTYTYGRAGAAPVVSLPLVITVLGQGGGLDLIAPSVVEAINNELDFTWLGTPGMATIRVPQYPGMAVGHTVRARWFCRVAYLSEIKTVQVVGPIDFKVPRDEVIDAIGSLVDVNYTVEVTPGTIQTSKSYALRMRQQPLILLAPSIYFDNTNVRASYLNSLTSHSVAVRWKGVVERQTQIQHPEQNGYYLDFAIPASWVTENQGREVLVNYAVGVGDNPLIFSQITRKVM